MTSLSDRSLNKLEKALSVSFKSRTLIEVALTHRSFARQVKNSRLPDNERLEFYGDAILKMLISDYLFSRFPQASEGKMSKLRSFLVSDEQFAKHALSLELNQYIRLSESESRDGGALKISILSAAFEAVIAACFLDAGYEKTKHIVHSLLDAENISLSEEVRDYKTQVQEFVQKQHLPLPSYRILNTSGPEHHKKFSVELIIKFHKDTKTFVGDGYSKKEAEQSAANKAMLALKSDF